MGHKIEFLRAVMEVQWLKSCRSDLWLALELEIEEERLSGRKLKRGDVEGGT